MNLILIVIIGIVVLLCLLAIGIIVIYNNYQFAVIKISEAENNIDIYLQKKLDFLTRVVPLLKEELKEQSEDIEKVLLLKSKKLNNFELNKQLEKTMHEFRELLDLNASLSKVQTITEIKNDLDENEDDLEAAKRYYNDNVTNYNKLIKSFPSNLVGWFLHYKHKDFYADEKEEMFEILKK